MNITRKIIIALGWLTCWLPLVAQNEVISFTTTREAGQTIRLVIDAPVEAREHIRIDLGDGRKHLIPNYGLQTVFTVAAQTIRVHGKVAVLHCDYNDLAALDVTRNGSLRQLWCQNNALQNLDLTENKELEVLDCSGNALTSLDVTANNKLQSLFCSDNVLSQLLIPSRSALSEMFCHNNDFENLNIADAENLRTLWFFGNNMNESRIIPTLENLPALSAETGHLQLTDLTDTEDANRAYKADITKANRKGWKTYDWNNGTPRIYEGETDLSTGITSPFETEDDPDAPVFNLIGTRVGTRATISTLKPGIYVSKNKKIIVE